jgi:LL-diaminopimelate aminotransferase
MKARAPDWKRVAAKRVRDLPPYPFDAVTRAAQRARSEGVDVIDLGVGDPDRPTPSNVVSALTRAARKREHHRYPSYTGLPELRVGIAEWFESRYGVRLDPDEEVLVLLGAKDAIAHSSLAYLDPGDSVLVPDPAYPVYSVSARFVGARPVRMRLRASDGFFPGFSKLSRSILRRSAAMWLCYPNNPTGATVEKARFAEAVEFAKQHDLLVLHDAAYAEVTFDGYEAPSILQVRGAKSRVLEVHSFSKTFNMTGWRVGFAVGGRHLVRALAEVKTNIDSGTFGAIQEAALAGLSGYEAQAARIRKTYGARRDILCSALSRGGWRFEIPRGGVFVWARLPGARNSAALVERLITRRGVVATPGAAFGPGGSGYVRFSLTVPTTRLREAAARLASNPSELL